MDKPVPALARRSLRMVYAAITLLLLASTFSIVTADKASADVYGPLRLAGSDYCLWGDQGSVPLYIGDGCDGPQAENDWDLHIVERVNGEPRYTVRNAGTNSCLTHFASNGRLGFYPCTHAYADQRWAFRYAGTWGGRAVFRLQNKHSGRCLVANYTIPNVWMARCGNYQDQYFYSPG
jgi:hypothetical protein